MPFPPIRQAGDWDLRPPVRRLDDDEGPSHNLWVGNLPPDTVDAELTAIFAKYGPLDSVSTYAVRNYAFINFKHLDGAMTAKAALQGSLLRGNVIKIEFARPARPGKNLWVGGVCPSISKEQLESEFSKFGKIEDFKFLRDRNSALINYHRVEDAVSALKTMNGNRLGGEQLRVDYLRSQPPRREWAQSLHQEFPRVLPGAGRRDIQSRILWVGYPPAVQVDERMLHNAMILFGEIEEIQCFPAKNYSIVEFRSVDEARRAKEGLQGRLFNDPRIQILFSTGGDVVVQPELFFPPRRASLVQFRPPAVEREAKRMKMEGVAEEGGGGGREDIWRGVVAKGGTPVCCARCVPVGKGIQSPFPEVVNCTAKTGLETLAKHCAEAAGLGIVVFLPDSEHDFPSYTDFLQYLSHHNRAAVAKLADGASLFLVPPSPLLPPPLHLSFPNRLYGLVLRLPLPPPPAPVARLSSPPPSTASWPPVTSPPPTHKLLSQQWQQQQQQQQRQQQQREQQQQRQPLTLTSQLTASPAGESEAEKNQRYQSTLQLAAALLMQIQKQQGPNATG
ncbi:flowering time control protein FPA-like isoform X2 [Wolffia australiana]